MGSHVRRAGSGGFRRLLLMAAVIALPLQDHLPAIAGFSVMYLIFAVLGAVAIVVHPRTLLRVATHPVFIAGYVLAGSTLIVELLHTNSDLLWWGRMAQMIVGGVIVASYVRSDREVQAVLTAFLIASVIVAFLILRSSYGAASSTTSTGYTAASLLRVSALSGLGLRANWNVLGVMCASAAGIAAARTILSRARPRMVYLAVTLVCTMGAFLTFSRSAMLAVAVTLGYVFMSLLNRKLVLRLTMISASVLLFVWLTAPRVVFERFQFSFDYGASGKQESRVHLYSTLIRAMPSYFLRGVGSGNYWSTWAFEQNLAFDDVAPGTHNTFLQVAVFWGVTGLLTWSALGLVAWLTLLKGTRQRLRYVPLKALLVGLTVSLLVTHDIADKKLSIALGLIAGVSEIRRREDLALRRAPLRLRHSVKASHD